MKKFVMGLIVGAVLMFSSQAFGAGISYIGKKVDGQSAVTINGEKVGEAIVIQGKSFVPVREITTGFGGKVDSTNGGVIALSKNSETTTTSNTNEESLLKTKIEEKKATVDRITGIVNDLQEKVDNLTSQGIDPITQNIELEAMKKQLEKEKAALESLQNQLDGE